MANKYDGIMRALRGKFSARYEGEQPVSLPEEHLAEVEAQLGYSLPSDYREFLRDYGDFHFTGVAFPLQENPDDFTEAILFLTYGATMNRSGIVEAYKDVREQGAIWELETNSGVRLMSPVEKGIEFVEWPQGLLPIGADPSANTIALSLTGSSAEAVFLWIGSDSFGQNVYLVADSFDDFMHSLYLKE